MIPIQLTRFSVIIGDFESSGFTVATFQCPSQAYAPTRIRCHRPQVLE